ncbi:hypothetical protein GW17_00055892 [Ensete ventricosum]|nr:hypothetical protein GW17_00055892 [Ensete ventricosum]
MSINSLPSDLVAGDHTAMARSLLSPRPIAKKLNSRLGLCHACLGRPANGFGDRSPMEGDASPRRSPGTLAPPHPDQNAVENGLAYLSPTTLRPSEPPPPLNSSKGEGCSSVQNSEANSMQQSPRMMRFPGPGSDYPIFEASSANQNAAENGCMGSLPRKLGSPKPPVNSLKGNSCSFGQKTKKNGLWRSLRASISTRTLSDSTLVSNDGSKIVAKNDGLRRSARISVAENSSSNVIVSNGDCMTTPHEKLLEKGNLRRSPRINMFSNDVSTLVSNDGSKIVAKNGGVRCSARISRAENSSSNVIVSDGDCMTTAHVKSLEKGNLRCSPRINTRSFSESGKSNDLNGDTHPKKLESRKSPGMKDSRPPKKLKQTSNEVLPHPITPNFYSESSRGGPTALFGRPLLQDAGNPLKFWGLKGSLSFGLYQI